MTIQKDERTALMKNKKLIWRILASICTLIWTIVIFPLLFFPAGSAFTLFLNVVVYTVSICISLVLIVFPMKFYLCAIMCWIWGFLHLLDSGSNNGLWMYALGCAFAYKQGFFVKFAPKKYLVLFPPLIAIAFQYRFGSMALVASIIDFLVFLMIFMFVLLLFGEFILKQNGEKPIEQADIIDLNELTAEEILILKELIANKAFTSIGQDNEKRFKDAGKIDLSVLTVDEISMVEEVLDNKVFKAIGKDRNKGVSAIKQLMTVIYRKLGVDSKKHLVQLYEDGKLIFPE